MADGTPPDPPVDLSARAFPIRTVPMGTTLYRVHRSTHAAKYFGWSASWRFDDPTSRYGTLYAALKPHVALAETLLRGPGTLVASAELAIRSLCRFTVVQALRLVALHGRHLRSVDATAAVTPGAYVVAQRWSRTLHEHPDRPDGIAYRATHDNDELAVVIFERASVSIDDGVSVGLLDDTGLLGRMLDHYRAALK